MDHKLWMFALLFGSWLLLGPSWLQAEVGGDSKSAVVTVQASERVQLKPERLRLTMSIQAKGNDPKTAMTAFIEHREKVKRELEALKVDRESIRFMPPNVAVDQSRNAMSSIVMNSGPGRKRSAPKPPPAIYIAKGIA